MKIPLSQGYEAIIDDADWPTVAPYKWHVWIRRGYRPYAVACVKASTKSGLSALRMHRLILGVSAGQAVDHINGDGLDNRRANLRVATQSQNLANARPKRTAITSKFKGVRRYLRGKCLRWTASIKVNYKAHHLGYFLTEEDAARAYDAAAVRFFGKYARLNFPVDFSAPAESEMRMGR